MKFLSRLLGKKVEALADRGVYFCTRCGTCGRVLRVRLDPDIDLNAVGDGYELRKRLVDDRCFRPYFLEVVFDKKRRVLNATVEGGTLIEEGEWLAEKDLPRRLGNLPPTPSDTDG